jgi:hypothetical protein
MEQVRLGGPIAARVQGGDKKADLTREFNISLETVYASRTSPAEPTGVRL